MTFLRAAGPDDRDELARFECARPERQFELDVEEFVRDAIAWLEGSEGVDREVLVLEDSGEIVGVVQHEDDDGDRFDPKPRSPGMRRENRPPATPLRVSGVQADSPPPHR